MKEVDFDIILKSAERSYRAKVKWHFHILTPACIFNKEKKFAIIFEDEVSKEQLVAFFDEKPLKEGEKLEALFYGRV
ncbi:MAG: hypothetical protein HYW25_05260 [Candidatus Aenigmarchaeota archaeon]|nr:hypothetical protein [Candidatus Aenigmarchaeota archaeon]